MSKVTVVGAGKYGSTTVQRIAEWDIVDEVVMTDIVEDLPQGLALDMNQSRPVLGYRTEVVGTNDYADTADSDVVVITAGLPRKPGMSRMDLLGVNAGIVKAVTEEVVKYSPDAVIIVVTNPLDQMTTLAAEVSGFPKNRVLGQAGMLDSARFAHFIAEAADVDILSVNAVTLGSHGETMVPVPSLCSVGDTPLVDALDDLVRRCYLELLRQQFDQLVLLHLRDAGHLGQMFLHQVAQVSHAVLVQLVPLHETPPSLPNEPTGAMVEPGFENMNTLFDPQL